MIPIHKLSQLSAGQRRRKLALLLAQAERELVGIAPSRSAGSAPEYVIALARLAAEDPKVESAAAAALTSLSAEYALHGGDEALLRLCDAARHGILGAIGTFPAEWDLIHRPVSAPDLPVGGTAPKRSFFPGVAVYAEDIRSPFNLGSVFRTAEAFGAERVYVSPLCVPPEHPRAARSAMGCIDYLDWERLPLEALPVDANVFALETGGTPIEEFDFPERGIVVIGSEELGVSPEALERATYGRVTIPMHGIKASLNVGVAFGVLMQAWTSYLNCSASKPF